MRLKVGVLAIVLFLAFPLAATAKNWVDEPSGCFDQKIFPCGIRVEKRTKVSVAEGYLHLQEKTSVLFPQKGHLELLEGALLSDTTQTMTYFLLQNPVDFKGVVIFIKKSADKTHPYSKTHIFNLNAQIEFSKNQKDLFFLSETLPMGFENWFGGFDAQQGIARGLIKPFQMDEVIDQVGGFSPWNLTETKVKLQAWKPHWSKATHQSSELYSQVISRRLAFSEEQKTKTRRGLEKTRKEREFYRKLLKEKAFQR